MLEASGGRFNGAREGEEDEGTVDDNGIARDRWRTWRTVLLEGVTALVQGGIRGILEV